MVVVGRDGSPPLKGAGVFASGKNKGGTAEFINYGFVPLRDGVFLFFVSLLKLRYKKGENNETAA